MDLEVAHAIAPDAQKVVVNARPTVEGDGAYEKIGQMFESVDRQFPGAVWSLSIGWGCDELSAPRTWLRCGSALATAQKHGTSAFDASGDTAGLECKGGDDWSSPPGPDDVGLDAVSSLPAMTIRRRHHLVDRRAGGWLGEHAWIDSPLSQGTSGGVSALFARPAWQSGLSSNATSGIAACPGCRRRRRSFHRGEDRVQPAGRGRCGDLAGSADLGRTHGADEPVPVGAWRTPAGQHQPAAVSGCRGCEPAGVPRYQPWRERRRLVAAWIRRGDRPRQPERRLPGARPPGHSEWCRTPMMHCAVCDTDTPAAAYCGTCGAHLSAQRGDGRGWLRIGASAAEPGEHVLRLSIASTLFPHLPHRSRASFRVAMALLFLAMVVFALLRWQAPLVAVSALGLPLLFGLYMHETDIDDDLPIGSLILTAVLGVALGVGWALVSGGLVAQTYDAALGDVETDATTVFTGVAVPVVTAILTLTPAVVVRLLRPPPTRESLDGFVIGALGAIGFTAAATLTRMAPQFATGPRADTGRPISELLAQAAIQGVALPLTAAALGRLGRRGPVVHAARQHQPTTGDRAAGGEHPCRTGSLRHAGVDGVAAVLPRAPRRAAPGDRGDCPAGLEDWRAGHAVARGAGRDGSGCSTCCARTATTWYRRRPSARIAGSPPARRRGHRASRGADRRRPRWYGPATRCPRTRTRRCLRLTPRTRGC